MKTLRRQISKILKTLMEEEDVEKSENLLFEQAKTISECFEQDLQVLYKKISYERLGELHDIPKEKRLDHLRSENERTKEIIEGNSHIIWNSLAYKSFEEKGKSLINFRIMLSLGGVVASDVKCHGRNCKISRVIFYLLQTRSGDEGSTIFHTCLNCGNKW